MQFVPLWTTILRSRKVAGISESLRWTWVECLLTAQEHDHKHGTLPNVDDMSYALHMESEELMSRLSRLSRAGFLDEQDGVYSIHDWEDWKYRPDPTAAARKRAERERKNAQDKHGNGVKDEDMGHDRSSDVTVTAVTSEMSQCHAPTTTTTTTQLNSTETQYPPYPPSGDDVVDFGRLTLKDRFDLESIGEQLSGWRAMNYPDDWIKDAILCAKCRAGVNRTASYINTCLRRWKARGGPDPVEVGKARADSSPPIVSLPQGMTTGDIYGPKANGKR